MTDRPQVTGVRNERLDDRLFGRPAVCVSLCVWGGVRRRRRRGERGGPRGRMGVNSPR